MFGMRDVINGKTQRNARGILNDVSSAIARFSLGFSVTTMEKDGKGGKKRWEEGSEGNSERRVWSSIVKILMSLFSLPQLAFLRGTFF